MAGKKNMSVVYQVRLEGRCPAYVQAENWEQATVKAAAFWGISWGANVAHMEPGQTYEARKNLCLKCRRIIYGERELCEACEAVREQDRARAEQRMKRTWYMGRKNAAFGK